jgi:hypothetical protein
MFKPTIQFISVFIAFNLPLYACHHETCDCLKGSAPTPPSRPSNASAHTGGEPSLPVIDEKEEHSPKDPLKMHPEVVEKNLLESIDRTLERTKRFHDFLHWNGSHVQELLGTCHREEFTTRPPIFRTRTYPSCDRVDSSMRHSNERHLFEKRKVEQKIQYLRSIQPGWQKTIEDIEIYRNLSWPILLNAYSYFDSLSSWEEIEETVCLLFFLKINKEDDFLEPFKDTVSFWSTHNFATLYDLSLPIKERLLCKHSHDYRIQKLREMFAYVNRRTDKRWKIETVEFLYDLPPKLPEKYHGKSIHILLAILKSIEIHDTWQEKVTPLIKITVKSQEEIWRYEETLLESLTYLADFSDKEWENIQYSQRLFLFFQMNLEKFHLFNQRTKKSWDEWQNIGLWKLKPELERWCKTLETDLQYIFDIDYMPDEEKYLAHQDKAVTSRPLDTCVEHNSYTAPQSNSLETIEEEHK